MNSARHGRVLCCQACDLHHIQLIGLRYATCSGFRDPLEMSFRYSRFRGKLLFFYAAQCLPIRVIMQTLICCYSG